MRYLPFVLLLALFAGCDRIDEPFPPRPEGPAGEARVTNWVLENLSLVAYVYNTATDEVVQVVEAKMLNPTTGMESGGSRKRVLLEDFTGHRCNNCPAAAATALQLQNQHPEDVVVVGVHATEQFAAPLPAGGNGSYTTDFRTEAGNAYEQAFNITWLPAGMVNRKVFDSSRLLAHTSWTARVNESLGQQAVIDLWFSKIEFNEVTNKLAVDVKAEIRENVSGAYNLIIYVTEDHVIDWQYNAQANPPDVPEYEHRHVLRGTVNGTWGQVLVNGSVSSGDTVTLTYTNYPL